jgi:hypothetical protein
VSETVCIFQVDCSPSPYPYRLLTALDQPNPSIIDSLVIEDREIKKIKAFTALPLQDLRAPSTHYMAFSIDPIKGKGEGESFSYTALQELGKHLPQNVYQRSWVREKLLPIFLSLHL